MIARVQISLICLAVLIIAVGCKDTPSTKTQHTIARLSTISETLKAVYLDISRFPSSDEGLNLIFETRESVPGWNGPYAPSRNLLRDGWGNHIVYVPHPDLECVTLYSYGPNGVDDHQMKDDLSIKDVCAGARSLGESNDKGKDKGAGVN